MAGIHASMVAGETTVATPPLTVTGLVNDSTPLPLSYSGTGTPLNSADNVTIRASGGVGPYSVTVARSGGFILGSVKNIYSTTGYTGNQVTFTFDIPFPGTQSTTFTATVNDLGSPASGTLNFTVNCTRIS